MPDVDGRAGVGYQAHGVPGGNGPAGTKTVREVRDHKDNLDDSADHSDDEWVEQAPKKAP